VERSHFRWIRADLRCVRNVVEPPARKENFIIGASRGAGEEVRDGVGCTVWSGRGAGTLAVCSDSPHNSQMWREGWLWNVHLGQARSEFGTAAAAVGGGRAGCFCRLLSRCDGCGRIPQVRQGGIEVAGVSPGT